MSIAGKEGRLVGLAAALAGVLLSASFFLTPVLPWPDQGTTLEAAINHAEGRGLVVSSLSPVLDITRPGYHHLTYFPPLYPLLVSSLLQLGLDPERSVRLVNLLAVVLGCFGWCQLASRRISGGALWLFGCFLVLCGGAVIPLGGTVDQMLWAGVPFWGMTLIQASESKALARALGLAAVSSAIAGVLIGVRWASAFLVIAGCLYLMTLTGVALRRRLALAFCHGVPATAAYLVMTGVNQMLAGQGNYLDFLPPQWAFARLWTSYPLESLVLSPIGLDKVLRRLWQIVDPAQEAPLLRFLVLVVVPMAVLFAAAWSIKRSDALADRRLSLGVCTCLGLVGFLAFMSVRYSWSAISWSYLDEPRYFRPAWPLALFLWLAIPSRHLGRLPRVMSICLIPISAYLLQARIRWEVKAMRPQEWQEATRELLSRAAGDGLSVVFDVDTSSYRLARVSSLVLLDYPEAVNLQRLHATRDVDAWIVNRTREDAVYSPDKGSNRKKAAALIHKLGAELVWRSSRGGFEVFHARVAGSEESRIREKTLP